MKKILIISASPRMNGNCAAPAKSFAAAAGEAPAHPTMVQAKRAGKDF